MSTLKVGTIQDHTNSITAMTIDSAGRVSQPAKPCFAVKTNRAVNSADFTTAAAVPFNEIDFQRGGTIVAISGSGDTTSAVFTAPITGIYQFNLTVNLTSAGGGNVNSTLLYIDGAVVSSSNDLTYRNLDDNTGGYHGLSSSFLISLNTGQTVTPFLNANGDSSISVRNGCRFSGFLVS